MNSSEPVSTPKGKTGRRGRNTFWIVLGAVVSTIAIVLFWGKPFFQESPGDILQRAQVALVNGEYHQARDLASRIPVGLPIWAESQLIAGEACTRLDEYDDAISHYQSIPRDDSSLTVKAASALGEIYRTVGDLTKAEREYETVLRHDSSNAAVHERLGYLLALTRRLQESRSHFLFLAKRGQCTLQTLAILGDLERPLEQVDYLNRCARQAPDDVLVQMGLATNALYVDGDANLARKFLDKVVAQAPRIAAGQAMLGEVLANGEDAAFLQWHAQLPPSADENPNIWFVRGLWARRHNMIRFAARCFWETVRNDPTHRRGNYHLGQVLVLLGQPGTEFAQRAQHLFDLTRYLDEILRAHGNNEIALKRIVELMEQTGRIWEACAWAEMASHYFPKSAWPQNAFSDLSPLLQEDSPQTIAAANLAMKYDLSHLPAWDDALMRSVAKTRTQGVRASRSPIAFETAKNLGIDFTYRNGDDPSTPGVRMFEQTGGGVAVLDLDGDRWPDLYFTQGAKWVHGAAKPIVSPASADRVYRNIEGRRFVDVTQESGLGNQGFGQGVAVGDFDADGFPDLYVANIGQNRIYKNNGDGTFTDATAAAGLNSADWTTSCVVVDLNADGLPDLFDVNYVTGPNVYSVICNGKGCSPLGFDGISDRLLINNGDGSFRWLKGATPAKDAKGLGVVAFDLHERGRPCLFVANDQVPNFLLRNTAPANSDDVWLENEGFISGLGFNMDGLAMACMGIAIDDADGDGRLDFFVTNFKDESNTLYLQDVDGLFLDRTNVAGLSAPSLPFVGWGTQFLDADLDGAPDLVVVNGNVDDYRNQGGEYRMRPQFFRNNGEGKFAEIPSRDLGPFFKQKHLGRSLARLDWNRDGRMDFVVSNINEPAALVTNVSTGTGHFLGLRLYATTTARDAIGSVVEVEAGGHRWKKQLVAGDGYQASNERLLLFGLGENDVVSSVTIRWPSGNVSVAQSLAANTTLEVVEGMAGISERGTSRQSIAIEYQLATEVPDSADSNQP